MLEMGRRDWITWGEKTSQVMETALYAAIMVLLAGGAGHLLLQITLEIGRGLAGGLAAAPLVPVLNKILLVLMLVEIMHTVQASFLHHQPILEPFLAIGLIAGIRRMLVITAEQSGTADTTHFSMVLGELVLITLMSMVFLGGLYLLRRGQLSGQHPHAPYGRSVRAGTEEGL